MKKAIALCLLVFVSCVRFEESEEDNILDKHSFARPATAVVRHLDLDISVDFTSQTISGKAAWKIDNISKGNEIIFDQNNLTIEKVTIDDNEKPTKFRMGNEVEFHGKPLIVSIDPGTTKVTIYYRTNKDAVALQWLQPVQAADKTQPFLFSQGQSIWTRTWVPCQDSPGIRFTYNATVKVPQGALALMSAENPTKKNPQGIYEFRQSKSIPAYLLAIAVGDLAFKPIDSRTGVYAEPSLLDKSAAEFSELGKMVDAAEKLFGPYRWGRYDVLVLPPSFPYGGMENPNLTFLTPGVLAGDRSLTGLLAHELGHSWSGNLVTNATWDDIWLNEGFTTYVEHRIGEEVFGRPEADMQDVLSRKVLADNIAELGNTNPDTRLKVDTDGRNPDDALTDIPYEKGYAFLQMLERTVGREKFDAFLKGYFDSHAFKSVTTDDFVSYLETKLLNDAKIRKTVNYDEWIFKPGIPSNIPEVKSENFAQIDKIQNSWRKTGVHGLSKIIKSTNEKIHFIDHLPADLSQDELAAIDREFHFTDQGNFVVKRQWFVVCIKNNYQPAFAAIENFMISTSRTGTLQTLYKEMVKTPEGKKRAREIFNKARKGYHATTVQSVEGLLK